jgi:hypothetical protein
MAEKNTKDCCLKFVLVLLSLAGFDFHSQAQSFNEFTSFYKKAEDVKTGELNFRFESLGFFQNNEYANTFVDGYSLTGAMLRPKLGYSPADRLYLEVGAHLLKYNGKDGLVNAAPWFSARYQFSDRFSVITGNLDQTNQHGLPEQLWEPERIYTDKPEAGLQFLYSGKRLNAQTWVSWEQFIQKNDPYQEHFTVGITSNYRVFSNSRFALSFPIELLFYHKGGEINLAGSDGTRPKVQTHANFGAGLNLKVELGQKIKSLNFQWHRFGFASLTQTGDTSNIYPFQDGWARFIEASLQTRHSRISLGHWKASQFIAPKGRELYQTIFPAATTPIKPLRTFLSAKYVWQKDIAKGARIAFQVEAYLLDSPEGGLPYSYGCFLLVSPEFLLKVFNGQR